MESSRLIIWTLLMAVSLIGCRNSESNSSAKPTWDSHQFSKYWHAGKAELSSYNLSQSRYGEKRRGKAMLIFVTEDLLKKDQVKADNPTWKNSLNVLKLNYTKNFVTGIYPYAIMLSLFTPVNRSNEPLSLKATMSAQEWCGQVYTQLNLRGNRYVVVSHSYFDGEADQRFSFRQAMLEDEIYTRIRLDHTSLPVGEVDIVPGLMFSRLNHKDLRPRNAVGRKVEADTAFVYSLSFPDLDREMMVWYRKEFPFQIMGWREAWTESGERRETAASLDKTLYTDYWTKNKNDDKALRDSLGLPLQY